MAITTGADGETLVRFSTEFHNHWSRRANCGCHPQVRGTGAEVCEKESRNAQVTGIHRRESRWDAIATEHAGAGEPGAGGAGVDDATLANAAFQSRLDKLLESAIEEQEREQQGFLTVLQASRDAVNAVRSELDGVRSVIEHREQAVIDLLDGRLALAARQDPI